MDRVPSRVPRPAGRGVINGSETEQQPAYRQPEESQAVREEPRVAAPRVAETSSRPTPKKKKSLKRFIVPIIIVIVLIVLAIAGKSLLAGKQDAGTAIDSSKYQAVFLNNGQVYFGKLHTFNDDYVKLTDVFYLQTQSAAGDDNASLQATTSTQNNVQLIKLGNEVHGPEDEMVILKSQMTFFENLKADGKVAKSIETYKKTN